MASFWKICAISLAALGAGASLPAQNPDQANPNGNHTPQWVVKAVRIGKR